MNKVSHVLEFYADLNVKYESFDFVLCNDIQTWGGERTLIARTKPVFMYKVWKKKNRIISSISFQFIHNKS